MTSVPSAEIHDDVIIGRGPSAYGALLGMLERGRHPTLLAPAGPWLGPSVDPGKSPTSSIQRKTSFGSSAMYLYPDSADLHFGTPNPLPLSAVPGGLSTVWGSNIQVFGEADLAAWGEARHAMPDSYAALLSRIPHVGQPDQLSRRFPWPRDFAGTQPTSARVRAALAAHDALPHGAALVGLARNATAPVGAGCIACGACLDGCPEGVIFDAERAIGPLVTTHRLAVEDGMATRLEPVGDGVRITVIDRRSLTERTVVARRVVLAAGSVATTILLQRSGLLPGPAALDDTQVFYAPLLSSRRPDRDGTRYSLAQMFATDVGTEHPSNRSFHLSIYESDPSFRARAAHLVGPVAKAIPQRLFQQMLAAIGFIPSQESGTVVVSRERDGILVTTRPAHTARAYVDTVIRAIRPDLATMGLHAIRRLIQVPEVGASYHVGHLTCDSVTMVDVTSGRLTTTTAPITVADGAALPAVLTGPVTLTMMANAYRIAMRHG